MTQYKGRGFEPVSDRLRLNECIVEKARAFIVECVVKGKRRENPQKQIADVKAKGGHGGSWMLLVVL